RQTQKSPSRNRGYRCTRSTASSSLRFRGGTSMTASTNAPEQGERRAYWIEAAHALHLEGRLPDDAYVDRITGCHSKHYLLEILEPQIAVAQQCGFPLSLVLVEIARMHQIRYTYGNLATNGMLKDFAD